MSPLAVVICTRDRPAQLEEALRAAVEHGRPDDQLVVVDSASTLASVREIAAGAGATVVRAGRPGLSVARNAGLRAVDASLVAFTDDDCRITAGWARAVETAFAGDPTVGFVTGQVVADRVTRLNVSCFEGDRPLRFDHVQDPTVCGTGANMAFRREACLDVGGFDELLGAGAPLRSGEDTDMFWRLSRAGWAGVFEPSAVVRHIQWRSDAEALRLSYGYGLGAGAVAVKAVRSGDREGWRFLTGRMWSAGLRGAWTDLRSGYQTGAAARCLSAAGAAAGALRAWRLSVEGDRFAP